MTVIEKSRKRVMASFRLNPDLLMELGRIAEGENVTRIQILEGWIRAGIDNYRRSGLTKVNVRARAN